MLTEILIKNFTIIDALELPLARGFSVITGETGAGKSILIDAVHLALGGRADIKTIRTGTDRCTISLVFDIQKNSAAQQWLATHDFSEGKECIIQRTIQQDGKSRNTINGHPCPQNLVREFSEFVLTIHGQHQHQALLQATQQRQCLDNYAHNEKLLASLQEIYREWTAIDQELTQLQAKNLNKSTEISLLTFQLQELTDATLKPNEWVTLSEQHRKLYHAKDISDLLEETIAICFEQDACALEQLNRGFNNAAKIAQFDSQFNNAKLLLENAVIQLQEAMNELTDLRNQLDLDPPPP